MKQNDVHERLFKNRYLFTGQLVLKTGLHIGGGKATFSPSDAPIIRTPDGKPFVPGSSFKGAFRSTVEKLAPIIDTVWSCGLDAEATFIDSQGKAWHCIGPQGDTQTIFNTKERNSKWSNEDLLRELDKRLCDTCKLFGSSFMASHIIFADLYTTQDTEGLIQIRDGVAIDRDSERAVDTALYNYEVVAPTLSFDLQIWLDDPTTTDLGLTCLGLNEYLSGFGYLGGKRSRGLGQCEITGLKIYRADFSNKANLLRYLTEREPQQKMDLVAKAESFINEQIKAMMATSL